MCVTMCDPYCQDTRIFLRGRLLWCVVLLLPAIALAHPRQDGGYFRNEPAAHHKDDGVHYKYQYAVDDPVSGVVNDRWEQRHGDFVKGQYSLLDPDGKVRTVDYEVDGERGFHAVIRTQYPAPALLSIQSASQVHEVYQDSPVNIRAKAGLDVPEFALRNPRFSVRDNLPFNYHALDASKIGIDTGEDGPQLLEDEGALPPREAHRRKYHRENHLLPHERFLQQDLQDQSIQQDTRQDLQQPYNSVSDHEATYSPAAQLLSPPYVFNPRAEYINLRPHPRPLSPLPPPNPAVASTAAPPPSPVDVLLLQALHRPRAAAPLNPLRGVDGVDPAFLFQPAGSAAGNLHTRALLPPPPPPARPFRASRLVGRGRVVQHHTETSPGLKRSYYL